MRHRLTKYRLSTPRRNSGSFLSWFAALTLAVLLAAIWWHSHKVPAPTQRKPVAQGEARPSSARPPGEPTQAVLPAPAAILPRAPTPPPAEQPEQPIPSAVPPAPASGWPRPVRNVIEAQLALALQGISPGSIDGVTGSQTRAALTAFQRKANLPVTGQLDANTRAALLLTNEPYTSYIVTSNDLARLQPLSPTWLGKSKQTALDYETELELVAEKFFSSPDFIRRLNPGIDWSNLASGAVLQVPAARASDAPAKAAFVVVHLEARTLEAFDENTNLLAHFPCSIARLAEKRPVGELHVSVIAPHPNYTFDPEVFPESAEARQLNQKLIIPPGPNNPVGIAWVGLDLPGYGIHGTPSPEQVGRTESHGCFRLANWNAELLLKLVTIGTPVYVEN